MMYLQLFNATMFIIFRQYKSQINSSMYKTSFFTFVLQSNQWRI